MEEQIPILNEYNTSGWEGAQGSTTVPYQKSQIEPIPDIPMPKVIDLTDQMKPADFNTNTNNHYNNSSNINNNNSNNGKGLVDWSQLDAHKGKIIMNEQVPSTETSTKSDKVKAETYVQETNNEQKITQAENDEILFIIVGVVIFTIIAIYRKKNKK